jgi:hypothetical protein
VKTLILTLAATLGLSACTVSVPIIAKTNTGVSFVGDCTGSPFGSALKVTAYSDTGLMMTASWNAWDAVRNKTIRTPIQLSDGRHGTAIVSVYPYGGMGIGKLNDGTTFKFFAGNAMPDQQIQYNW